MRGARKARSCSGSAADRPHALRPCSDDRCCGTRADRLRNRRGSGRAQVAAATPERQRAPVAAEPESDPNSPIGVWAAEDNKGNVRIEQCGENLCGYAVKTGEKVLINMKPQGSKWAGRIQDPDSGRK